LQAWLHVAALSDAAGNAGWVILPSRPHPLFAKFLAQAVPPQFLRPLPHLEGWWVDGRATIQMVSAIHGTTYPHDLCQFCVAEAGPCDHACLIATSRGQAYEKAVAQWVLAQEQKDRTEQEARDRWAYSQSRPWSRPYSEPNTYGGSYRRLPGSQGSSYRPPPMRPRVSRDEQLRKAAGVLGMQWPASQPEIKKAYRSAILKAHPDMPGGSHERSVEVNNAKDLLVSAA